MSFQLIYPNRILLMSGSLEETVSERSETLGGNLFIENLSQPKMNALSFLVFIF